MFVWNFLCSSFCPLPLVLFCLPPKRVCLHWLGFCTLDVCKQRWDPLSVFSSSDWTVPGCSALPFTEDCSRPLIIFISLRWALSKRSLSVELGRPELGPVLQMWPHQGRVKGKKHLPRPAGHTLCNAAWDTVGCLGHRGAQCWLMTNLLATRTPKAFTAELLSRRSAPNLHWWMLLFLLSCETLHLLLLNLIRFFCPALQSVQVFLKAAQPSGMSATPHSSVSSNVMLK